MDDKKIGFLETVHNVVSRSDNMQKSLEFVWKLPDLNDLDVNAFRMMLMEAQSLLWCQSSLIKNLVEAEMNTDEYIEQLKEKLER